MPRYARVLIDRTGAREFDYAIPAELEGAVSVGTRVRVPMRQRVLTGTVLSLPETPAVPNPRPIAGVVGTRPLLDPVLLRLGEWIARYYCCPVEAALRAILPETVRKGQSGFKQQWFAAIRRLPEPPELDRLRKKAPRQAAALDHLAKAGAPVAAATLAEQCTVTLTTLRALQRVGWIVLTQENVDRDPWADEEFLPAAPHELNPEQAAALAATLAAVEHPANSKPLLLHGVTGSGKTEIYLQAIEHALGLGKTAIVLVPEIALTPQTVERFKSRFARTDAPVAVLHSHLSAGERHDEWHKARSGRARIVIGARSAVFAPLENLGLIVVDEEHEHSYKQEETPRYQARDVAVVRASMEPCAVLLGSATPALESWQNAIAGKYELLQLRVRADDRKLPRIRVIDLRMHTGRTKGPPLFSERLRSAIEDRLEKREQTILFLNRRGYATSLQCPKCGHVCMCPNCSISLTYHRAAARMNCHLCGHSERVATRCPACSDPAIRHSGAGTERIEDVVAKVFPKARVARMDADTMTRKEAYRETLGAFRTGRIDILIGTQMIAKGLHFPNVTLVGIVNADLSLHLPDFRAGERTFQLLTQVAGRAGRGEVEGDVYVQTYTPFSPSIQWARRQDYEEFAAQELGFRREWNYPPFTHLALLTLRSPSEARAAFCAETLARRLKEGMPDGVVLGEPAPAPLARVKGQYRFHLSLRGRTILRAVEHLRKVIEETPLPADVRLTVDVDPCQLM